MIDHIKWAWQRVTRGYDDRLMWDLSEYIGPMILAQLRHLREDGTGYPSGITEKKWNKALDIMIAGFEPEPMDIKHWKKWYKKRQKALVLFAFYFDSLWS